MVELKSKKIRMYYGRCIPQIKFDSVETEIAIASMFETDRNIYEYFGLLLLRFGYQPEDNIFIYNYDKKTTKFMCSVNKNNVCQMFINRANSEIVISKLNYEFGYECIPEERTEIGMKISLGRYTVRYDNEVVLTRYLSRDKARFVINVCDSILELQLDRPEDIKLNLFDEKGKYAKYKLDKEDEIISYLSTLDIDKNLVSVYEILCGEYLGDISRYPDFSLKFSKINDDGKEIVTDLIHLKNGKLEKVGMTDQCNRTIFIDKDDNWSYEMPCENSLPVQFSISQQNEKVNCTFSISSLEYDVYKYMKEEINSDVKIAMDEVVKKRRLVREIFGVNNGSN